jgi:uncharacterized protein (TIGR03382 family)
MLSQGRGCGCTEEDAAIAGGFVLFKVFVGLMLRQTNLHAIDLKAT